MIVPDEWVPLLFRDRVRGELRRARKRALQIMPLPVACTVGRKCRVYRRAKGMCAGCGCLLDDRSPDCSNCTSRHWMRAHAA